jgi:hypothetical protein
MITRRQVVTSLLLGLMAEELAIPRKTFFLPPRRGWPPADIYTKYADEYAWTDRGLYLFYEPSKTITFSPTYPGHLRVDGNPIPGEDKFFYTCGSDGRFVVRIEKPVTSFHRLNPSYSKPDLRPKYNSIKGFVEDVNGNPTAHRYDYSTDTWVI